VITRPTRISRSITTPALASFHQARQSNSDSTAAAPARPFHHGATVTTPTAAASKATTATTHSTPNTRTEVAPVASPLG
jgi:hypothetical protein